MNKKIIYSILATAILFTTGVAYANEINIEEGISEGVVQGTPEGPGEDLGVGVVSQGSGDIEGVPGASSEDSEEIRVEVKKVEITEGEVEFGGNNYNISNSKSVDFPGSFKVNAAAGDVSGTPVNLTNTGETEIIVYAEKCKSMDNTSPSIVSPDSFSDWTSLSQEETVNNLALGFKVNENKTFWFENEDSQQSEEVYRLAAGESITLAITGKCGTQWPKSCTINYDCTVAFEVVPIEKEIEVIIEEAPKDPQQEGQEPQQPREPGQSGELEDQEQGSDLEQQEPQGPELEGQDQQDQSETENTLETDSEDNSEQPSVPNIQEETQNTQTEDQLDNEEQNNNQEEQIEGETSNKENQDSQDNAEVTEDKDIDNINIPINTELDIQ